MVLTRDGPPAELVWPTGSTGTCALMWCITGALCTILVQGVGVTLLETTNVSATWQEIGRGMLPAPEVTERAGPREPR